MDGDRILSVAKIIKGALTIPVDIRRKANLEDGSFVSVEYKSADGVIVLKPKSLINHENHVKLSKKDKKMINEALDAEKSGEVIGPFSDIKEALKALKES
jgi:bifunctional DNA-binding transcriptional regulator/antitoxin component of YhaV-PrlF toxin-antitoxin module